MGFLKAVALEMKLDVRRKFNNRAFNWSGMPRNIMVLIFFPKVPFDLRE